ncbi:WRKY transcription factor 22-like [Wolffia australiana]
MTSELWDLRAVVEGFSYKKPVLLETPVEDNLQEASTNSLIKPPKDHSPKPTRRRKIQQKKVVRELTENELSDGVWAWRKYGQKPIKDSPYPRGYYRCSSSKGCPARKQVERSRAKPGMFTVTFTAEHNHEPLLGRRKIGGAAGHGEFPAAPPASPLKEDDDFIFTDLEDLININFCL